MISRWLPRVGGTFLLCLAVTMTASAQYGGSGGGTMGGTGQSSGSGYGNGKAIGIGVGAAAGATVAIVLLVRHHHHQKEGSQASLIGCVQSQPNGISSENEEDGVTYMLVSAGKHVEPGQRVELKGVVKNDGSGGNAFRVRNVVTNFGACSLNRAASIQNLEGKKPASIAD